MKPYRFDPDPHNTHQLLLSEIPDQSMVLEIGTASGYLGEYLVANKRCDVWGVEPNSDLYTDALSCGYTKLLNTTAEMALETGEFTGQRFDRILLGDVLEHLVAPDQVLALLRQLLKPGGRCVISLPNVAHYSIRWSLLCGKWHMTDAGILDRTHLRFFTRETATAMIEKAGCKIISCRPSAGEVERFGKRKLFGLGRWILFRFPTLLAVQFIFVAEKRS